MYTHNFKILVAKFIDYRPSSGEYNQSKARELADKFEATEGAVIRWVAGKASPREAMKKQIIRYIRGPKTDD